MVVGGDHMDHYGYDRRPGLLRCGGSPLHDFLRVWWRLRDLVVDHDTRRSCWVKIVEVQRLRISMIREDLGVGVQRGYTGS